MANSIGFLRGPQENFDKLSAFKAGSFYLTEDSGRLYYANSNSSYIELNQYVHQVASLDDLAASFATAKIGDFYYAVKENILCTKKEGATAWTQINRDTNTNDDTKVTSVSFERDNSVTDKIKMNLVLKQTTTHLDNTSTVVADVIGSFELTQDDFNAIVDGANVSIGAAVETNKATIKTSGIGADSADAGISIIGAGSVTISGSEDAIIINGVDTKYNLGSAAGSTNITFTRESDNNTEQVAFAAGQDINVTGANANEIKIAHATYSAAPAALGNQTPGAGTEFDIVSGVTLSNGHVTGVSTAKVKLPGEKWYSVSSVVANDEGDLIVTVIDQANSTTEVKAEKKLYYKVGDTLIYNHSDLKDHFYTEAEIDDKLNGLNAMTYRGTVGATDGVVVPGALATLPTEGVKVGDTYMAVGGDGVEYSGSQKAGAGDLLIATGSEVNGVITSNLAWTYVPSANEIDTTYKLRVSGTNIVLTDSGNESDNVAILGDGTHIATAQAAGEEYGIVISHKDVARNDGEKGAITPAAGTTFDIVQSVVSDSKGHVTKVGTVTVTLPEDKNNTYSLNLDDANKSFTLVDNENVGQGKVIINGNDHVAVAASVADGATLSYAISHIDVARDADTTADPVTLAHGGKITVVTGVSADAKGHIKGAETTEITLPDEITYKLNGNVAKAADKTGFTGVTVSNTLTDSTNTGKGTFAYTLESESLNVTNSNNTVDIELVWGSF